LAQRLAEHAGYHPRTAGPGREFDHLCPDLLARVSLDDLAALAERAFTPKPAQQLDLSHITPIRVTVAEAVAHVLRVLSGRASVTFRELTSDCDSRIDVVVRFLAVLELVKRGEADVKQVENFGEIAVTRVEGGSGGDTEDIDDYGEI
jgi:segregation and condensation protein A